jgi:hypothetical protein
MMYKMLGFEGKRGVLKPFWPAKPTGGDSGGVAGICLRTRSTWSAMWMKMGRMLRWLERWRVKTGRIEECGERV